MAAFFKFILIVGFLVIVAVALTFFWFYRKIHNIARSFGVGKGKGNDEKRKSERKTYGNRTGVIDARTPEQVNRKIFKDNEGEYVDFTEVD
ncbi:MAG: DUF4834 family protein [Prevotella sp.]|uniref:DUF4834 family protein n=1 Tax=Prevotella sp. TaxID=59823 RepID=UPI002A2B986F|nr:DUF4834 family protein [Prevotella sp.]MDD7317373.1 DUF4834 family protein [Prevotellaceae bacterium]MDY4019471.1 DUF4834 family protein [Prevotella sp.]